MTSESSIPGSRGGRRPPQLSRDFIARHTRQRAVDVAVALAVAQGVNRVTVTSICRQAGMSRKTFYDNFENTSACLDHGLGEAFEQTLGETRDAEPKQPWLASLDATIGSFYAATTAAPVLAEFCLVHAFGLPRRSAGRDFEAAVEIIAARLHGGRDAAREELGPNYRDPPPLTEDYLARAVVSLAALKLRQGAAAALAEHRDEMVMLVAGFYHHRNERERRDSNPRPPA
jgi:AcrR family transcriptional regulator